MRVRSQFLLPPPNFNSNLHSYETISDLMNLQDQIESFQKLIFTHFQHSVNNECHISALVPLVKESYNIYQFITSMPRAMLCPRATAGAVQQGQHHNPCKLYFECSNLKYLMGFINVPKLGANAPNLLDNGQAPELPKRLATAAKAVAPMPPPDAGCSDDP